MQSLRSLCAVPTFTFMLCLRSLYAVPTSALCCPYVRFYAAFARGGNINLNLPSLCSVAGLMRYILTGIWGSGKAPVHIDMVDFPHDIETGGLTFYSGAGVSIMERYFRIITISPEYTGIRHSADTGLIWNCCKFEHMGTNRVLCNQKWGVSRAIFSEIAYRDKIYDGLPYYIVFNFNIPIGAAIPVQYQRDVATSMTIGFETARSIQRPMQVLRKIGSNWEELSMTGIEFGDLRTWCALVIKTPCETEFNKNTTFVTTTKPVNQPVVYGAKDRSKHRISEYEGFILSEANKLATHETIYIVSTLSVTEMAPRVNYNHLLLMSPIISPELSAKFAFLPADEDKIRYD